MYASPGISRAIRSRMVRLVTRMAEERHAYGFIVEIAKGRIQLRGPRSGWVANLKTDLKEIVYYSVLEVRIGTSDWLL